MKKIRGIFLAFGMLSAALFTTCASAATQPSPIGPAEAHRAVSNNFKQYFDAFHVEGSIVIYDLKRDTYTYYNPERCDEPFSPASTFKIPNSLIGLETGAIPDENYVIKWDGVDREVLPEWNQDQTLRSAFKYSVVWYYQELARRVGAERMQSYIGNMQYGNQNIGGGIDQFWLKGDIRISQNEQIEFLKNLYKENLPFAARTMGIVKDIMIAEETDAYTLRAKTGWQTVGDQDLGWYVGYVEKGDDVYFFATHIASPLGNSDFGKARIEITKACMKKLNIL